MLFRSSDELMDVSRALMYTAIEYLKFSKLHSDLRHELLCALEVQVPRFTVWCHDLLLDGRNRGLLSGLLSRPCSHLRVKLRHGFAVPHQVGLHLALDQLDLRDALRDLGFQLKQLFLHAHHGANSPVLER